MEKYERRSPHEEVQAAPRHHHGRGTRRHPLRRHARRLLLRQGRTAATTAVNLEGKALNIHCGAGMTKPFQEIAVDWQHLFGRFRKGQPRLPELDRRHAAQRRVDPKVVVPVNVVRELGPEPARRAERLAVDELGLQYPVGRLVDGVVAGAALGRQRPLYAEGLEHRDDLGVVELAAAVRVEDLNVRDWEGERRERRLDQPGVLPGPGGVADDLPVAGVDEQAGVVPRGPDAHGDVWHVGLADRPGAHLEPLPALCADRAVLPHDAAGPAPADGDARPPGRRLYLARAVPALAGGAGRDHGRRGGVRRGGPAGPRAHGAVRRPRDAEEPALRRYGAAALVGRHGPHFRAYIGAARFKTSTSIRSLRFSRSSSRIRSCPGVRLSAARGEPAALIDSTHLSTVLLPRPYSSMASRLGLPAL